MNVVAHYVDGPRQQRPNKQCNCRTVAVRAMLFENRETDKARRAGAIGCIVQYTRGAASAGINSPRNALSKLGVLTADKH
jgi:hypothetical protein